MSVNDFIDKIGVLRNKFQNLQHLAITGGEPFLHHDIVDLLKISSALFKFISITTNGTIFNQEVFEFIKK
ncbi:MAG: radical SAM protein [Aeromonas sp.]|uniref:radical SAM protein n=1 Tax=Aeromonas sp. TaxID=647 RepID=UPI003D6BC508